MSNLWIVRTVIKLLLPLCLCVSVAASAPSADVVKVREWRAAHERQILAELMQLAALPSIASNKADIVKNADVLTAMFEKRGFGVKRIATPGSPLLHWCRARCRHETCSELRRSSTNTSVAHCRSTSRI